jgi:hypothetical protein
MRDREYDSEIRVVCCSNSAPMIVVTNERVFKLLRNDLRSKPYNMWFIHKSMAWRGKETAVAFDISRRRRY